MAEYRSAVSSDPELGPEVTSSFSRNYLQVIRRLLEARWRGTPMHRELDDAVQEVFVECLRPDGPLSRLNAERGSVSGVLFGVTRNIARRFEERAAKRAGQGQGTDSMFRDIAARESSLSVVFDREWARTMVRMAGERMRVRAESGSPGARLRAEVLRLRFTEGLPIRDIATQWDVDPDSVHRAYAKAREEFRGYLRRVVAQHAVRTEVDLDQEVTRVLDLLR